MTLNQIIKIINSNNDNNSYKGIGAMHKLSFLQ